MTRIVLALAAFALLLSGCASTSAIDPGAVAFPAISARTWVLATFADGTSAPTSVDHWISLNVDGDGASGGGGCNRYFATVHVDGRAIAFSRIGSTRMACEEPNMGTESRYLRALAGVTMWSIVDGRLVLSDNEGRELLTFTEAAESANMAELKGTVTYRQRIALPPAADLTVRLLDVSRADAPADVIAEWSERTNGEQVPLEFALLFSTQEIEPRNRYVIRADIRDTDGKLLWTTDRAFPVLTNGAPSENVEVTVVQVNPSATTHPANPDGLVGASWELRHMTTGDGGHVAFADPERYSLRFGSDGRYGGRADCNSIAGSYTATADGSLRLGAGVSTLASCAPPSEGTRFLEALSRTKSFSIADGALLIGLSRGGTLHFSAAHGVATQDYEVRPDSLRIDDETYRFHYRVDIPFLSGASARTNNSIRDSLAAFAEAFRPTEVPDPDADPFISTTTVEGGYEVALARPDVFSALVDVYAFSGGAHGITVFRPININPQAGRWIEFGDVVRDTPELRQILADAVTEAAVNRMTESGDVSREYALDTVREFTDGGMHFDYTPLFTLTEEAIVIHISLYEVGPYAIGTFAVPVAWNTIRDFVRLDLSE